MKIVTKYVLKEHFGPLVFSVSALTSLLLLNAVAKRLGELVGKGLHWTVISEYLLLSVPFTIAMTLPMAVLVATLYAFSRLASENEITAFRASGVSLRTLMVPVVLASSVLMVGMIWFMDQVLPAANHRLQSLTNDIARKKPTFALKEQVINEVSPQKLFLRTAHLMANTNRMRDVTIYDLGDPQHRRTIRADSGLLEVAGGGQDLLLTLYDGNMVELSAQEPSRLQRIFFHTDLVKVRGIGNSLERDTVDAEKSDREMTVCELQQRVVRAVGMRDSAYRELRSLDSKSAGQLHPRHVGGGVGALFCRLKAKIGLVRIAHAGETPPRSRAQQPVAQSASPQSPPPAAQQPVPQQPAPQPAAATPAPPVQAPLPGATPSGVAVPDTATSYGQRLVMTEGIKMQLAQAQYVIDGNEVEIEKKFAIPVACVIFALLGAPIALRFPRGGVGLTIGVSLTIFGLYYVGLIAGEDLARHGKLSPFLAMWTTNFILLAVGAFLMVRLGSEGSTSRGSETTEFVSRLRERLFGRRRTGSA